MGWSPPPHAQGYAFAGPCILETIAMNPVAQVGIDLGKHTFHLHGQDRSGREVFRKKLTRPR